MKTDFSNYRTLEVRLKEQDYHTNLHNLFSKHLKPTNLTNRTMLVMHADDIALTFQTWVTEGIVNRQQHPDHLKNLCVKCKIAINLPKTQKRSARATVHYK